MSARAKERSKSAATATQQDPRWAAVVARERTADGTFWCAVVTTGVYCRPSCPGRPAPQNVRFYDTPAAARSVGFRACKRCRPDEAVPVGRRAVEARA